MVYWCTSFDHDLTCFLPECPENLLKRTTVILASTAINLKQGVTQPGAQVEELLPVDPQVCNI